jgi:hypothetical protein
MKIMKNCYWFLKYNALKIKYDVLEDKIAKSIKEHIEEEVENRVSVEWYKKKNQLLRKQLKECCERNKEIEKCQGKKKVS